MRSFYHVAIEFWVDYIKLGREQRYQFPPEIISTKFSKLLRYNIIQTLVILGDIVDVAIVADGLEVATGTF